MPARLALKDFGTVVISTATITAKATAGLLAAGKQGLRIAKDQAARRGADLKIDTDPLTLDPILTEALDVLLGDAASAHQALGIWTKAKLSARPPEFEQDHVREWLRRDEVAALLKRATRSLISGSEISAEREAAEKLYHASSGDQEWYGGALFDIAVTFLLLTVGSKVSAGDRAIMSVVRETASRTDEAVQNVEEQLAQLNRRLASVSDQDEYPSELVAEYLTGFLLRESRSRSMTDPDRVPRVLKIAEHARDGRLRRAPDAIRAALFRFAAATLARNERAAEAQAWLDAAIAIGALDVVPDNARIALRAGDPHRAITLLRGRKDAESQGLLIEALALRDGEEAALSYFQAHVAAQQVSGFTLSAIATWLANSGAWDDAERLLAEITDEQAAENPALTFMRARLRLSMLAPVTQRIGLFATSAGFPQPSQMRNDAEGARLRTASIADLQDARMSASELQLSDLAEIVEVHILFLELVSDDMQVKTQARVRLSSRLEDPAFAVGNAWLAMLFDVEFDKAAFRSRLEERKLLDGWSSSELAAAAQLHMQDADGDAILQFVDDNRVMLAETVAPEIAFGLEIEVLAKKGKLNEAQDRLDAVKDRIGDELVAMLSAIIAEQSGEDGLALRLSAYENSLSDRDLALLVEKLHEKGDPRLGGYAAKLWRSRHRIDDAIAACNGFYNAGYDDVLSAFLDEIGDLIDQSPRLQEHRGWAAFMAGRLPEAQGIVDLLRATEPDRPSLRQLAINVSLEAGEWHRLGALAQQDHERREHRSASQLIQAASLAHAAANPIADDLLREAVALAPDDTKILLPAYGLAVRRGRDWDPEPSGWLRSAIAFSGDNGPIKQADLRDIVKMREEGAERAAKLDRMIMAGQVTLGLAVRPLNTTLSELILGRLHANLTERDPRRRLCLPLLSGNRLLMDLSRFDRVGLDPAAILSLQLVGLLGEALHAFPRIVLPSGTLPLLFSDLERADRGQPSRVAQALRFRRLLDDAKISLFDMPGGDDSDTENYAKACELEGYWVASSPLFEPGSLLERVRDAKPFGDRLISPQALIDAIAAAGEITSDERISSVNALSLAAEAWDHDATLAVDLDRAFVMDAVALHRLDTVGMLEPLLNTGAALHVARTFLDHCEETIAQQQAAERIADAIEATRNSLHAALVDGRATIGPFRRLPLHDDDDEESGRGEVELVPLVSLLGDSSSIDVLISGEALVNAQPGLTDNLGRETPIATPIDIINHLHATGAIDDARLALARRTLREAGVAFAPVTGDEIAAAAAEGDWSRGAGRSLRAICQSIHLPLLRRAVTLPRDNYWLGKLPAEFALAIRRCWVDLPDVSTAIAASDFLLLQLPDIEAYAEAEAGSEGKVFAQEQVLACYCLLAAPLELAGDRLATYHDWHRRTVERRLRRRDAHLIAPLLERLRDLLLDRREWAPAEGMPQLSPASVAALVFNFMPAWYRERLVDFAEVREKLSLDSRASVKIAGRPVGSAILARFLRALQGGEQPKLVADDGTLLAERGERLEDGTVRIEVGHGRLVFTEAPLFSASAEVRLARFAFTVAERTLTSERADYWRDRLASQPLSDDDFFALIEDLRLTPEGFAMNPEVSDEGGPGLEDFVWLDERYFSTLIGGFEEGDSIGSIAARMEGAFGGPSATSRRLLTLAPLAIAPDFKLSRLATTLSDKEAARLCTELADLGDPFSAVAAFELACSRIEKDVCRKAADDILQSLLGDRLLDLAHDFCFGAHVSIGQVEAHGVMLNWPVDVRRYACLVQAAHAARRLSHYEVQRPGAFEMVQTIGGKFWRLHGLVERHHDSRWFREWLIPSAIAGHILFRIDIIQSALAPELRPETWSGLLTRAATDGDQPLISTIPLPGPLDGLSTAAQTWPLETDPAFFGAISPTDETSVISAMIRLLTINALAEDGAQDADLETVVRLCAESGHLQAVDAGFMVAARWHRPTVAFALLQALTRTFELRNSDPASLAQAGISAGAAHSDKRKAKDAVVATLEGLASQLLPPLGLYTLARFLDGLVDVEPQWSSDLRRARTMALLGLDGRQAKRASDTAADAPGS